MLLKLYSILILVLLLVLKIDGYLLEKYKNEWITLAPQGETINQKIVLAKDEFMKFRIVKGPFDFDRMNVSITSEGLNESIIFYSHDKQEIATKENCEGEKKTTGFGLSRCNLNAYYFSIQMNNKWLSGDIIFNINGDGSVRCR